MLSDSNVELVCDLGVDVVCRAACLCGCRVSFFAGGSTFADQAECEQALRTACMPEAEDLAEFSECTSDLQGYIQKVADVGCSADDDLPQQCASIFRED